MSCIDPSVEEILGDDLGELVKIQVRNKKDIDEIYKIAEWFCSRLVNAELEKINNSELHWGAANEMEGIFQYIANAAKNNEQLLETEAEKR